MHSCCLFEDFPYDEKALTYKNKFIFDNQFRMDGMYLVERDYDGYGLVYFFQNGSYYAAEIDCEIELECIRIPSRGRDIPYYWGCFIIEDSILKVQTYASGSLNQYTEYKKIERWAEIVNDTTIHFFKGIDTKGKVTKLDETYHFKHCTNKPDSTNILMR